MNVKVHYIPWFVKVGWARGVAQPTLWPIAFSASGGSSKRSTKKEIKNAMHDTMEIA